MCGCACVYAHLDVLGWDGYICEFVYVHIHIRKKDCALRIRMMRVNQRGSRLLIKRSILMVDRNIQLQIQAMRHVFFPIITIIPEVLLQYSRQIYLVCPQGTFYRQHALRLLPSHILVILYSLGDIFLLIHSF